MDVRPLELTDPQADIVESSAEINLFLAGQGSGKTHCAGIVSGLLITDPATRHLNGIIAANTYGQLTKSTLKGIRRVWREYFDLKEYDAKTGKGNFVVGIQPPACFSSEGHDFDSYNNIISFSWGTAVFVGSLDNYKSLDGMEVGWAVLDETKDTPEAAVKEVILGRLRQNKRGANPLYIFTSPAKVPWINEWFELELFDGEIKRTIYNPPGYFKKRVGKNKFVTISAAYLNQHNLPPGFIERQRGELSAKLIDMLIYGDPLSSSGGELFKSFARKHNVGKWADKYDPRQPLHISFDQNVRPFITATVLQVFGKTVYQIDEVCLSSPRNKSEAQAKEILTRYYHGRGHTGGVFIYGDPSGKREDTRSHENDYSIILRELAPMRPGSRLEKAAPAVSSSAQFVDKILESGFDGIEYHIDECCKHTIADFTYLKEAPDGGKYIEKEKGEDGVPYEKYGHCSDTVRYFFVACFAREYAQFSRAAGDSRAHTTRNRNDQKF